MKEYIAHKTIEIENFSKKLSKDAANGIRQLSVDADEALSLEEKARMNSRPDRPYLLLGTAGLAAGVIGKICASSEHPIWAYLVGCLGAASVAYGVSLRRKTGRTVERTVNYNEIINSQVNSVYAVIDETKGAWNDFMKQVKEDVQAQINSLPLDTEKKDSCMSHTFYVQQLDLDNRSFNDRLYALPHDGEFVKKVNSLRLELAVEVERTILNTAKVQINEYQKINGEL